MWSVPMLEDGASVAADVVVAVDYDVVVADDVAATDDDVVVAADGVVAGVDVVDRIVSNTRLEDF